MAERWFLRVGEKEYGPADLLTLRDWLSDGRVLRDNEARPAGSHTWILASDIPGLFAAPEAPEPSVEAKPAGPLPGFLRICFDSIALYIKGFFPYLGLTLLVVVPSLLSQLTASMIESSGGGLDISLRTVLGGAFSFCMMLLTMLAWPVYIAGIQILTADLAGQSRITFFEVLNRSLKVWPRVAVLCVIVYTVFLLLIIFAFGIMGLIITSPGSPVTILIALALLVLQVWMFSRYFINVMFWQQCAVLEKNDITGALRESKALAHSRRDLVWYKRPLWKGVFVFSLWTLFLIVLALPTALPAFQESWRFVSEHQNPQDLVEALSKMPRNQGVEQVNRALGLVESMLKPLLGIPFVLIYLAARSAEGETTDES